MGEYFKSIKKRNGSVVPFDKEKIVQAVFKAAQSVGGSDIEVAKKLAEKVVFVSRIKFDSETDVPSVEQIQDIVEKVLVEEGHAKTAKAYILYREQQSRIREMKDTFVDVEETINEYLHQDDWRVKENSNEAYSFSGLLLHTAGKVIASYALTKIYPKDVSTAYRQGYIHIHDLSHGFIGYCAGWSLKDLLTRGFGGVANKVDAKPAKHLDVVVHQMVNFIGCLQMEFAGAQAFSSVDTLLSPFVRADNLTYRQTKQCLQELVYSLNIPSRWGCFSEDTEILTDAGWKLGKDLDEGEVIATFNMEKEEIEYKPVLKMTKDHFKGKMHNLKNRITDQLVTPNHKVLRRIHNFEEGKSASKYVLEEAQKLKTKIPLIPLGGKFKGEEIDKNLVKSLAWIVSEGSLCRNERIAIYQSQEMNPENCDEIRDTLDELEIPFDEMPRQSGFTGKMNCVRFRLNRPESRRIHETFFPNYVKVIPESLRNISTEHAREFIDTYIKADGHVPENKIYTKKKEDADFLQEMIVKSGWGSTLLKNKNGIYVVRVIKHDFTQITSINEVDYDGIVWCPTTTNNTVVVRRNGKVFLSGNSQYPFSNLTFDWTVPEDMQNDKAVVGGKEMDYTYRELQKEMDMINKAFLEVMQEGDANGRIFTFPIPTYNLTKDFNWDSENSKLLFEVTAKYGTPYFQNYVGSDLDPKSIRAMCLHPEEEILIKKDGIIEKTSIGELAVKHSVKFDYQGWSKLNTPIKALSLNEKTFELEWKPIKNIVKNLGKEMMLIKTRDGKQIKVTPNHPVSILTPDGITEKPALFLSESEFLLSVKSAEKCLSSETQRIGEHELDEEMAKLLGFFVADGNFLYENRKNISTFGLEKGMQFTFPSQNNAYAKEIILLAEKKLGVKAKTKKDPRYNAFYAYFYNAFLSRELAENGLKKYGKIMPQIWNSPKKVMEAFLDGFFLGDGYKKRGEIHINDSMLARELVMLYHMIGKPVTFRERENSQVISIQGGKEKMSDNRIGSPALFERVPSWGVNTYKVLGLDHNRKVGLMTLQYYNAHTELTKKLNESSIYPIEITKIEKIVLPEETSFFDIELEENYRFVHSLGTITHNCCRLNMDTSQLINRPGGMWGPGDATGSIGVITINVNRLAFESETKKEFFEKLTYYMNLAKTSLEIKRKIINKNLKNGLMPFTKVYLGTFNNHFSTIGLVGMNEACVNFLGKDISSEQGKQFAVETLSFMREKCFEFQKETQNLYNLEATPAESASFRLAMLDKKFHPEIYTAGKDTPYLTNSTQLPVNFTEDAIEAIIHQNEVQPLYTGGTIFHTFLGEKMSDGESCKQLVKKIAENTKLPYYSITPTFSVCPVHGYIAGEHFNCPLPVSSDSNNAQDKPVLQKEESVNKATVPSASNSARDKPVLQEKEEKKEEVILK
ncbi:MAG: anaerobic ribonucleoside-triphosphate reductase [Candidatus Micrarchaeota archaeon]